MAEAEVMLPTPISVICIAGAFRFADDVLAAVLLLAALALEYALALRGSAE